VSESTPAEEVPTGQEVQRALLREVGLALHASIASGYDRIEAEISIVKGTSSWQEGLYREDGTYLSLGTSSAFPRRAGELRRAMYREGSGTWFTAWFTVTAAGKVRTRYDYDTEPRLGHFGAPEYRADFEDFPRTPEHTPAWLAAILAGAPTRHDLVGRETRRKRR